MYTLPLAHSNLRSPLHALRRLLYVAIAVVLTAAFAAVNPAGAQVEDTTHAQRYFPLEEGNLWEFVIDRWDVAPHRERVEITGRLDIGGATHYRVERSRIAGEHQWRVGDGIATGPTVSYMRFDEMTAELRLAEPLADPPEHPGKEILDGCSLAADFGTTLSCPCYHQDSATVTVSGAPDQPITVGVDTVRTAVKWFDTQTCEYGVGYAAGIGPLGYVGQGGTSELTYARVGDEEFGTQDHAVGNESGGSGRPRDLNTALRASVYPNPARNVVTAVAHVSRPCVIRATLFDLNGRGVAELAGGARRSGTHYLDLDVSHLAPGPYVLLIRGGGEAASRPLTIVR